MSTIDIKRDGLAAYCAALDSLYVANGKDGSPYGLLAEFATEKRWSDHEHGYGELGMCYMNAANLALWREGIHYVEGVALAGNGIAMPIEHAWCEDDEGNVIEVTWADDGETPRDTAAMRYLGVRVPDELLRATLVRREVYGVLDDHATRVALRELLDTAN